MSSHFNHYVFPVARKVLMIFAIHSVAAGVFGQTEPVPVSEEVFKPSVKLELSVPLNSFALKSLVADSEFGGKTWNASFTPFFAPVAKVSANTSWGKLSVSRKLLQKNAFWAMDLKIPLGDELSIGGFWRNWKGFNLQYSLEDAGANSSSISYDNTRQTFDRSDVRFLDRSLNVEYKSSLNIPPEMTEPLKEGKIKLLVSSVLELRNQELRSSEKLLSEDFADKFGTESSLSNLLQNSLGAAVGFEFVYELNSSQYFWNLDCGWKWIFGDYLYQSLPEVSKQSLGFSAGTDLGYRFKKEDHVFETFIRFDGTLNKASNIGFSSQYFLLNFSYEKYF